MSHKNRAKDEKSISTSQKSRPQILITLPDETKASTLIHLLNCMANEEDDLRMDELNLYLAIELVELCHLLKMRQMVS